MYQPRPSSASSLASFSQRNRSYHAHCSRVNPLTIVSLVLCLTFALSLVFVVAAFAAFVRLAIRNDDEGDRPEEEGCDHVDRQVLVGILPCAPLHRFCPHNPRASFGAPQFRSLAALARPSSFVRSPISTALMTSARLSLLDKASS